MMLAKYINELLYRYDCVIVPNFGGFITNRTSAFIDEVSGIMYPPIKKITFNTNLVHNDGLLVNHIALQENISFEDAVQEVKSEVLEWNSQLEKDSLTISTIGVFKLNEDSKIVFEPSNTNFLTTSFGLSEVSSLSINRTSAIEDSSLVLSINEQEEVSQKSQTKVIPVFGKYIASVAIMAGLGIVLFKNYNANQQKELFLKRQNLIEQKIQKATFVIANPLPKINLQIENIQKNTNSFSYHIIAGAFRSEENAIKKVKQLQEKGFKSGIVGKNKWGLTQVAYASFVDEASARKLLHEIQKLESKDAWVLVKN